MQKLFLLSFLVISFLNIKAQSADCKVQPDSLKGTYEGGCKNGKAEGKGKATGTDTYDGEFKNGWPDGIGKYSWKSGESFEGNFKKGLKEGKGELHKADNQVITGYWKKDKYYGIYEYPFVLISNSSTIYRIDCKITDEKGEDIILTAHRLSDGTSVFSNNSVVPVISNINTVIGTFYTQNTQKLGNSGITRVQQVTFPYKAIFSIDTGESFEILFNKKGTYNVSVEMR
jgi:hypothetical protein